jgi:hypothetical protein
MPKPEPDDLAASLVQLMPRDAVFSLRLLGESPHLLQRHFQDFIAAELAANGVTPATHPMIHGFVATHALMLRDFVLSGLAMAHQYRLAEIERLLGDTTSMLRVDIWDQIRSHIEIAERQFRAQAPDLPDQLRGYLAPGGDG